MATESLILAILIRILNGISMSQLSNLSNIAKGLGSASTFLGAMLGVLYVAYLTIKMVVDFPSASTWDALYYRRKKSVLRFGAWTWLYLCCLLSGNDAA